MLYIAVCLCWAASVFAAPAPTDVVPLEKQQPTVIPIVSQSDELEPNGTYHFSYETGNGIKRDEISYDKKVPKAQGRSANSDEGAEDDSDEIHVQIGSYSYTAPDGRLISVRYIADENGFQPIGDHIPRVPSASGSSSAEKSGRSLSVSDSAASSSQPAAKALKPSLESRSAASTEESSSTSSSEEATTKAFDSDASTTKATSEVEGSTVEAVSTEASTTANSAESEGSTTEAASSEASTATSEASSTAKIQDSETSTANTESSTPSADTSTTEASPSTTAAA